MAEYDDFEEKVSMSNREEDVVSKVTSSTSSSSKPELSTFKVAGAAVVSDLAKRDGELRIEAYKAQQQLRGLTALDR
jgi:hypothetical protein